MSKTRSEIKNIAALASHQCRRLRVKEESDRSISLVLRVLGAATYQSPCLNFRRAEARRSLPSQVTTLLLKSENAVESRPGFVTLTSA